MASYRNMLVALIARDLPDGFYADHFLLILNYMVLEEDIDVSMKYK
jgi:hypothetical protein